MSNDDDDAVRFIDHGFLVLAGLVAAGCLLGALATIAVNTPENALGPLSEWLPGTITAFALMFTLNEQRRNKGREQALDARQQQMDDRQLQAEHEKRVGEHRALASCVYVWTAIRFNKYPGTGECLVMWSNVGDAPAYNVTARLYLSNGETRDLNLGTFAPQERLNVVETGYHVPRDGAPLDDAVVVAGVSCTFRDANGVKWRRDQSGKLSEDE